MKNDFVTQEVCDLKHQEVKELKSDLKAIKAWLYTLVGAAMLNMVLLLIKLAVK